MNGDINPNPKYKVGQYVWIYDVNDGRSKSGPSEGLVTKVGRKLVTVRGKWNEDVFRIDTGQQNDNYGHRWILTTDERVALERKKALVAALREHNLEVRLGHSVSLDTLEAVVKALEGLPQTDQNPLPGTTTLAPSESG